MTALPTYALLLLALMPIAGVYAVLSLVVRHSRPGKARLEAGFEAFLGFFLLCFAGYPAVKGLVEGVTWFGARATPSVAVTRDASPTFYWVLEVFALVITVVGALIIRSGVRKIRHAREAAL